MKTTEDNGRRVGSWMVLDGRGELLGETFREDTARSAENIGFHVLTATDYLSSLNLAISMNGGTDKRSEG